MSAPFAASEGPPLIAGQLAEPAIQDCPTAEYFLSLAERHLQPEVMDQPDLEPSLHVSALRGLARLNRASGSASLLAKPIKQLAAETGRRHFRVLDVASGGGDVAIDLQRRAAAAGIELDIVGCDISETAIQHAQASVAKAASNVRFEKRNVLTDPPAEQFDIVTCSLFLHHLRADDAVALLENLSQVTGQLLLVNDLVRSRWGKLLADVACRVLSRSSVVHVDGPRSVEGAFTLEEAVGLCRAALLDGALVGHRWPCRLLIQWRPNNAG